VDDYLTVSDGEEFRMTRRLTREEGLFVGGSSGLIVQGAIEIARRLDDPEACLVAVLADWGEHYLSKLFDDDWMRENGFLERRRRHSIAELLSAKDAGAPPLLSVQPSTSVRIALSTLTTHDVSQLPVLRDSECVGSVTEGELMGRVIEDPSLLDRAVETVMEAPYPVVESHLDVEQATRLLSRRNAACLVRDGGGRIAGILTRYDVVRTLTQASA
jgi:cystathionine beta-synthase